MSKRVDLPTHVEKRPMIIHGKATPTEVRDSLFLFRLYVITALLTNLALVGWFIYVIGAAPFGPILFSSPFIAIIPLRLLYLFIVLVRVRNSLIMGAMGTEDWSRVISSFDPHFEGKVYCAFSFAAGIMGSAMVISQVIYMAALGGSGPMWTATIVINAVTTAMSFAEPIYIMTFGVWRPLRRVSSRHARAACRVKQQNIPVRRYVDQKARQGQAPPVLNDFNSSRKFAHRSNPADGLAANMKIQAGGQEYIKRKK